MNRPDKIDSWLRISVLGSGSFGIVTLWKNEETEECVAVKECKIPAVRVSKKLKERWTNEVELIENTRNENIVSYKALPPILDKELSKYNESKLPLLSMEYCLKGNLRHVLNQPEHYCGLSEESVKWVLHDLENALSYLHRLNITHRDIKPENIVLQKCQSRKCDVIYKVIDLGYAKEVQSIDASLVGTLQYLAPEIFFGKKYNKSVDYWSLGILTFEIICGEHPFLPHLSPPQRFQYIEKKTPDNICIFATSSGKMEYSSELLPINNISMCFKEDIEKWLRYCLQFNSEERYSNKNIFNELKEILNKKIVTVFSVFTFEFYHYEYNDSTLMSTLQNWIARDIKVQIKDQLILNAKKVFSEDCDRITDCCNEFEATFFIFKKNESIHKSHSYTSVPKLIKQMLLGHNIPQNFIDFKLLYTNCLYFIKVQHKNLITLHTSLRTLVKHIHRLFKNEAIKIYQLKDLILHLLNNIQCYKNIERKIKKNIKTSHALLNNIRKYEEYLHLADELVNNFNKRFKKHVQFQENKQYFETLTQEVMGLFDNEEVEKDYRDAILITSKYYDQKPGNCLQMIQVINRTLKRKNNIAEKSQFSTFLSNSWKLIKHYEILDNWNESLQKIAKETIDNLCHLHIGKAYLMNDDNSKKDLITQKCKVLIDGCQNNNKAESLICENISLIYSIEESVAESLQYYKNYMESIAATTDFDKNNT